MIILERFEDNIAVIENEGSIMKIERSNVADDVSEGDVLKKENGVYNIDKESTERRKQEILKLQSSLWG